MADRSFGRAGDAERELPPLPIELEPAFDSINAAWNDYNRNISTILGARDSIETVSEYVTLINESIPELLVLSDDVVKILVTFDD